MVRHATTTVKKKKKLENVSVEKTSELNQQNQRSYHMSHKGVRTERVGIKMDS